MLLCAESQNCLVKYSKRSVLAVKNISMTACVGNYFRLAFLPLLRKITECGNYCEASLDLEPVLLSAGAHSRQLQRRLCAWPGTLLLAAGHRNRSLGIWHQDRVPCQQLQEGPRAQIGLNDPNCPRGNRRLCCTSLVLPCAQAQHISTAQKTLVYCCFFPTAASLSSLQAMLGNPCLTLSSQRFSFSPI